jgi:hypothetical protein
MRLNSWSAPTSEELAVFMDAIAPTLFKSDYVVLACNAQELVLCEVRVMADGKVLHARVLPFN